VVNQTIEAGDHRLIVCKVVDAGYLQPGVPMLYVETEDMDGHSKMTPKLLES
jgi:hypothetical protein